MGEKLRRFLMGRYGMDSLNKLIFVLTFLCLIVMWFWPNRVAQLIFWILIVIGYFRCFSRNIPARYAENQKYLRSTAKIRNFCRKKKTRFEQRKFYRFYKCPKCKQQVRVPRGKGKINIRCPKCGEQFVKKS
ncbi:MAG: hypothetical protein IKV45_03760 [Firmicutes bacterium]|nr:hypothetical protein [Bacillota bacterium]